MTNYSEMSDFEINKHVAHALGLKVETEFQNNIGFTESFHQKYPNTIWCAEVDRYGEQTQPWEQKCFTHNPSDAWPIIDENKISLITDETQAEWKAVYYESFFYDDDTYRFNDKNPLRAAMIVYLMMNEEE